MTYAFFWGVVWGLGSYEMYYLNIVSKQCNDHLFIALRYASLNYHVRFYGQRPYQLLLIALNAHVSSTASRNCQVIFKSNELASRPHYCAKKPLQKLRSKNKNNKEKQRPEQKTKEKESKD